MINPAHKRIRQYDLFARHTGVRLLEVEPGRARASLKIKPQHLNSVCTVQGGAIATLADVAFAAACNAHGTVSLALNLSITYIRAARQGTLWAEARESALKRRVGTYEVRVTDDAGELVAIVQALAYRQDVALKDVPVPKKPARTRSRS